MSNSNIETNNKQIIIKPQKKHMVDFLYECCKGNDRIVSKSDLNKLTKDQLAMVINSDPSLSALFEEFMQEVEMEKASQECSAANSEKAAETFRAAADQLFADGPTALAVIKFDEALRDLPVGAISDKEIFALIDKFTAAKNVRATIKLLKYVTE